MGPDILTISDDGQDARRLVPGCMKHYLPVSAVPLSLGELMRSLLRGKQFFIRSFCVMVLKNAQISTRSLWVAGKKLTE